MYTIESAEAPAIKINDFQVLGSIKAKPEKKDLNSVKIMASESNKMNAIFENQIDSIKERLGVKDDEDEQSE